MALTHGGVFNVLARSRERMAKERAMRRRQLKNSGPGWLNSSAWPRPAIPCGPRRCQKPISGEEFIQVQVAQDGTLGFWLRKDKLREVCRREGRYLLRSNLCAERSRPNLATRHIAYTNSGGFQNP